MLPDCRHGVCISMPCERCDDIKRFARAILHGDEAHQEWLLQAAAAFNEGAPMPVPERRDDPPAVDRGPELQHAWEHDEGRNVLLLRHDSGNARWSVGCGKDTATIWHRVSHWDALFAEVERLRVEVEQLRHAAGNCADAVAAAQGAIVSMAKLRAERDELAATVRRIAGMRRSSAPALNAAIHNVILRRHPHLFAAVGQDEEG